MHVKLQSNITVEFHSKFALIMKTNYQILNISNIYGNLIQLATQVNRYHPKFSFSTKRINTGIAKSNNILPSLQTVSMQLLLLLLKKIGNARPGEGDWHPISPKTPAPHYQPIEEKKRKGK